MRGEANLVRRGSTYYLRIRVPTDLLDEYKPLREIRVSLRTSDKDIARQRVREHRAEYEREFAQRRTTRSAPPRDLRPEELDRLSKLYLSWRLQVDDDMRMIEHDEHLVEIAREQLQIDLGSANQAYSRGRLSEVEAMMEMTKHLVVRKPAAPWVTVHQLAITDRGVRPAATCTRPPSVRRTSAAWERSGHSCRPSGRGCR